MQHFVDLNSVRYCVYRHGEGDALMLLHGFTGTSQTWAEHIAVFSQHVQVITPDLLGHGETDSPQETERYRIEHAAADLIVLLDMWGLECVNLLGYSMGGRLALFMAVHYPDRIASLILESAAPGLKTEEERADRCTADDALADRIEREGIEAFVDYWETLPLWHSQKHTLSDEAHQKLRTERLRQQRQGLVNSLRGMGTSVQPSLWPELANVKMPVRLITGELDTKFVAINREMLALLPRARLDIVPDAGHTVHLENSAAFQEIVTNLLLKDSFSA